jgi:hypothetical protein
LVYKVFKRRIFAPKVKKASANSSALGILDKTGFLYTVHDKKQSYLKCNQPKPYKTFFIAFDKNTWATPPLVHGW